MPACLALGAALILLVSAASAAVPPAAPAELLVRWRPGAARSGGSLAALNRRFRLRSVHPVVAAGPAAARRAGAGAAVRRWSLLRFAGTTPPEELARNYAEDPGVEAVQANLLRRFTDYRPDDPLLAEQWNLDLIGWTRADPGSAAGALVAVIDSGIDADHPDLAAALWRHTAEVEGEAGVDDDGNGYVDDRFGWDFVDAPGLPGEGDYLERDADPDDESGHGTHVAGIVAAVTGNGEGVAGVAPGAQLMILRAGFTLGGAGYLQDDDIAAAIVYAADNGADVINLSLGDPRPSPLLADAVCYAVDAGVVVVAAAGNEGSDAVFYPARLPESIAVAAAGRDGGPAVFSNHGSSIDLLAPGVAIRSTRPGGAYGDLSGTSMAAPHVAAAAALIRAAQPGLTPARVLGVLAGSALDVGPPGWDPGSGHGLLQVPAAGAPLAVVLRAPGDDAWVSGPALRVEADVVAPSAVSWVASWGAGESPGRWADFASGRVDGSGAGATTLDFTWPAGPRAPGDYSLRVVVDDGDRRYEDRVTVHLDPTPTAVLALRLVRALSGARWRQLVEWRTARASGGAVELWRAGVRRWRMAAPPGRTAHSVTLPQDLDTGAYEVRVFADGPGAGATDSVLLTPSGVQRLDLDPGVEVADGYLMPQVTDFDGDGRSEVAAMVYGAGAYGATHFWELPAAAPAFVSSRLFIPWETGDFDLDGAGDLMAVDARRVRILEASAPGRFPDRVAWETRDVWGGEVADLDGDGRPELVLRSATADLFRVFESVRDDDYRETAALVNDTRGENELGDRQTVVDADGDGVADFVAGDSDGDLLAFRAAGDDAYRPVWRLPSAADHLDGRLLGPAGDLDGDGAEEFVAGRLHRDPFDVEGRRWTLTVYGSGGDGYVSEWQTEVLAGAASGNGIAVADLDGDGGLEWIAVLVPHLYVFQWDTGGYRVLWHADARRTFRPLVADVDGDGRVEVVYNRAGGGLVTVSWPFRTEAPLAPAGWRVEPAAFGVRLAWETVRGAVAYRVFRDGHLLAEVPAGPDLLAYTDTLSAPRSHIYRVAAVDDRGRVGRRTPPRSAGVVPPPVVIGVERPVLRGLLLHFDQVMDPDAAQSWRYLLKPELARVTSVVLDRGGRRALLGLDADLPDSGDLQLALLGLRAVNGAALADSIVSIRLAPVVPATRLMTAALVSPVAILIRFDRPVRVTDATRVHVAGGDVEVVGLRAPGGDSLWVSLSPDTPLRPLGRRYDIAVEALADDLGRKVEAKAVVTPGVDRLDGVLAFPNPFDPDRGPLTFAGLPLGTKVEVFALDGQLLWSGMEGDEDGGLRWDGRTEAGVAVADGIYLVHAAHGGRRFLAKVAVVRR